MNLLRKSRWMLLALLLSIVPASSFAGVLISVGITPPVLPVYEQPPCPEPGLMWTPGYWAYGDDGYFWVPGAWVAAPYEGALWTPPYWGWSGGLYVFHGGYWGPHVGYYGGVNYGFGYMGIGFAGGEWRGGIFAYNRAVVRIGDGPRWGGNRVYEDRRVVERTTIINNTHISYNGGPGGIRHDPSGEERAAMHEQHVGATSMQQQHMQAARSDRTFYAKNNGGHPQTLAAARPLGSANHVSQGGAARPQFQNAPNNNNRGAYNNQSRQQPQQQSRQPQYQQPQQRQQPQSQPRSESRPAPQPRNESRPTPQPREESRPQHEEKPHR
jgi:WXXGXW repeat (2 copies)